MKKRSITKKRATKKHPGFKAEARTIARREQVPVKEADAMLAASTRKDSSKAKKKNSRLKRVRGSS
jgi:hypothetical protein